MSTATTTNITNLPHVPHSAHPIPLREHAFTLHCQGLRSPAIAQALGVPERTVRAWIAAALDDLKDDLQLSRRQQLALAVERQNQLTATAWKHFNHEAAARDALLDAVLETILNDGGASSASAPLANVRLPASTPAPRYLSLIIQANKEINRLLGLYTLARLHLLTQESASDNTVPVVTPDIPAESATASGSPLLAGEGLGEGSPAESATASSSPASDLVGTSGGRPTASLATSHIPAESATASGFPLRVGVGVGVGSPAESATARTPHGAAGIRSANSHSTRKPQPWMM